MLVNDQKFLGTYAGRVVDNSDPYLFGRVKVRVPILHGFQGSQYDYVSDPDLPWAWPSGLAAGGSDESGGVSWIPVTGDQVWVRFLDGELEKPVWEWGNQNLDQAQAWGERPLHAYDKTGKAARRAALSRYGHWHEILPDRHDVWTKSNYHFEVVDEQGGSNTGGRLTWTTALGYLLSLDDSIATLTSSVPHVEITCLTHSLSAAASSEITTPLLGLNVGTIELGSDYSQFEFDMTRRTERGFKATLNHLGLEIGQDFIVKCASFWVTAGGLSYDADNNASTDSDTGFGVSGDEVFLGYQAVDPLVRMSDLVAALRSVKHVFDAHRHKDVKTGSGVSGVPVKPAKYEARGSAKVKVETKSATAVSVQ